jgi:hypothetical protein
MVGFLIAFLSVATAFSESPFLAEFKRKGFFKEFTFICIVDILIFSTAIALSIYGIVDTFALKLSLFALAYGFVLLLGSMLLTVSILHRS